MPGPTNEEFAAFRTLLALDADGRLTLEGVRTVIVPASILANIEESGRRILGQGWAGILYLAGERNGREIASMVRERLGRQAGPETIMRLITDRTEMRGLGRVDASNVDVGEGRGTLTMDASPLAESPARGDTRCYLSAGLWGGVVSVLAGREIAVQETECRATGAPRCVFTFAPAAE